MVLSDNQQVFFALMRAGLWEKNVRLASFKKIDYKGVFRLAREQSVVGLVAAGIEHVADVTVPHENALLFVRYSLQLEHRNMAMNNCIAGLAKTMYDADLRLVLVKGQGIARNYERPLWRASGDVDFVLTRDNYRKAAALLMPLATSIEEENTHTRHLAFTIDGWEVELHGTLRTGLWKSLDSVLDGVQTKIFYGGCVRPWMWDDIQVLLPRADEDIVYVFAHILQHFYKEGIGLRQICDWSRILWTFKDSIDLLLLERRIREMGVMNEWKAFACLTVCYLGMPVDAMPFYEDSHKWQRKADRILSFILEAGNFGHKRDQSFRQSNSLVERKIKMFWHVTKDAARLSTISPLNSFKFWFVMMKTGLVTTFKRDRG